VPKLRVCSRGHGEIVSENIEYWLAGRSQEYEVTEST
jgi:hypothetical protein